MLRISRGSFAPALNTPLARISRPVAALTAILVVAVFVAIVPGVASLVGSPTATRLQPVPAAITPPVVRDRGGYVGIPYVGTGPAADIIRGGYVEETHPIKAPVVRDTGEYTGIPYVGTGPAADTIRGGYDPNGR